MDIFQTMAMVFGGLNVIQIFVLLFTLKSQVRKEKATANQEEFKAETERAGSLEQTGEIYDRLTARVNQALAEMEQKEIQNKIIIQNQNQRIKEQDEKIMEVMETLDKYKKQCEHCSNNKMK